MNLSRILTAGIIASLVAACSLTHDPPVSESDARTALEQRFHKHMSDLVRLLSFRKTNGSDVMGRYAVEYVAEVEFLDDCLWDESRFWATRGRKTELDGLDVHEKKKGQREELTGAVLFRRTEKGWLPDND